MVHVESAWATPATVLRAKFSELRDKLENNQFEKPLYLDSSENAGESKGNLYALIQKPFPMVQSALKEPAHWCDILILHLNTKYCRASVAALRCSRQAPAAECQPPRVPNSDCPKQPLSRA